MSQDEVPFAPQDGSIPEINSEVSDIADVERRTAEVDRMYDQYVEFMRQPIVIPYNTFIKFEPLYTVTASKEIQDPTSGMYEHYTDLLKELMGIIRNPYKEYHIRMPTGETVAFPPLLSPVSNVKGEHTDSIDVFSNILDKCRDQPWKRREATAQLLKAIYESQNTRLIEFQRNKTHQIADKLKTHATVGAPVSTEVTDTSEVLNNMEFVLDD